MTILESIQDSSEKILAQFVKLVIKLEDLKAEVKELKAENIRLKIEIAQIKGLSYDEKYPKSNLAMRSSFRNKLN
jgi:regulator of replication initiation timing